LNRKSVKIIPKIDEPLASKEVYCTKIKEPLNFLPKNRGFMSIDAIGDSCYSIEADDRFSFSNLPTCAWLVYQLGLSYFRPSCELRPIEDKGSIADSLTAANIDIFDITPVNTNFLVTALKIVSIYATTALIPFMSVYTMFYRGFKLIQCLNGATEADHNWKKIVQYAVSFSLDAAIGVTMTASAAAGIPWVLLFAAFCSGAFGTAVLEPSSVVDVITLSFDDQAAAYKSFILRSKLGVVGKDGTLLSWDNVKDNDVDYNWFYSSPSLKGYFGNFHLNQGRQFLDLILDLQRHLPQNCKFVCNYPPNTDEVASFLDRNWIALESAHFNSKEWKEKFYALDKQLSLVRDIIATGQWLTDGSPIFSRNLSLDFPLSQQECLDYLNTKI
jgi:hypothetical protein